MVFLNNDLLLYFVNYCDVIMRKLKVWDFKSQCHYFHAQVLEGTHSQKTANKVRLVLQKVESGLVSNPAIDAKTMMIFIHTLTADNLPMLKEQMYVLANFPKCSCFCLHFFL